MIEIGSDFNGVVTHGSLFSGIGGFDLAAQWMDWENVFHCEWNTFGQQILQYYWPNAITYEDITKTDFSIHRGKIDILTGGFPCQPYSNAGKRLGIEDDRHLWPEMLRAIREIKPRYIVGENVYGIINWNGGLVFEEIQTDMENEGYEVQAFILPAVSVNAPHRRDRVWFVAFNTNGTTSKQKKDLERKNRKGISGAQQKGVFQKAYNQSIGFDYISLRKGINANSNSIGLQGRENRFKSEKGSKSNDKQFKGCNIFSREKWQKFPTQTPICNGNDGLSSRLDTITFPIWRNESVKGGGNAIVPQVALQIFKTIKQFEKQLNK